MYDLLLFVSLFAGWILLNVWVLPRLGIPTCMSGACRVPHVKHQLPRDNADQAAPVKRPVHE
ncbi:MAG: hypothetical protein U0941_00130 [Planctomycetaceae bacterium]|mgnify:FL=1